MEITREEIERYFEIRIKIDLVIKEYEQNGRYSAMDMFARLFNVEEKK